jgi:uncharacterized protein YukE
MTLYGMDVESGRRLSEDFARASERLLALSGSITPLVKATPWHGPDGQKFQEDWTGHRQQLIGTAHALKAASNAVRRNVEEQLVASERRGLEAGQPGHAGAASLFDRLNDSIAGGAGDLWDGAGGFISTVEDSARAGWNLFQDVAPPGIGNLMDAHANLHDRLGNFGDMGWRWLTTGEPPSITEFGSNTVLLGAAAATLGITIRTLGAYNPHLFDDGRPVAGDPIPVGVGDPGAADEGVRLNTPVPSTVSAIMDSTIAAYSDQGQPGTPDTSVRITTVHKPGEPDAYIISIPGTTRWWPDGANNPTDLTGNLELAGGNLSTAAEAVRLAMEKAGIPPGAPVMLSGHSQGGMIAVSLASNPEFTERFNVTNVVTFGSPIDSTPIPADIDVLALQHAGDPVPKVDLGDAAVAPDGRISATQDNAATKVTLPNPAGDPGIANMNYHDGGKYVESAAANEAGGQIAEYSQKASTQKFTTTDPGQVTSTASNLSRKQ